MNNIEVEIRSFISEEKYKELLNFFKKQNLSFKENIHETHYFDTEQDFRIYKTSKETIILLKKGNMHDEFREEIEIKLPKEEFEKVENLLSSLGFKIKVKWFRKRFEFKLEEINICLDYTKGYGYIIELEIMSNEKNKEKNINILKEKLKSLNIDLTPKEEFEKRLKFYNENWQRLITIKTINFIN